MPPSTHRAAPRRGATGTSTFSRGCYSDIVHLYWGRGIDEGVLPYVEDPATTGDVEVEYPVLTGAVMYVLGVPISDDWAPDTRARAYYAINAVLIALLLAVDGLGHGADGAAATLGRGHGGGGARA